MLAVGNNNNNIIGIGIPVKSYSPVVLSLHIGVEMESITVEAKVNDEWVSTAPQIELDGIFDVFIHFLDDRRLFMAILKQTAVLLTI